MFDDNNYSNDSNTHSQTMAGGTLRVTHGAPAPEAMPANVAPSTRVNNGTLRWNAGGGGASESGVTRWTHSTAGVTGGSVAATLAHEGGHWTVETKPGIPGSRTRVEVAERFGLIGRDGGGSWRDMQALQATQAAPASQALQATQEPAPETADTAPDLQGVFDPEEDGAWVAEVANVPQHAFDAAIALGTNAMGLGQSLETAASSLAVNTGMDPGQAQEVIAKGHAYFANVAARAATKAGVPQHQLETFWAHCMENPGEFMPAVQFMTYFRDVSRIQALARAWVAKKD